MASKTLSSTQQPLTLNHLASLESDFCNQEIVVRLLHFWEARNIRMGVLMGIELLLIDSESNAVQGFISASRLNTYEQNLKANSIYRLKKFIVQPTKKFYKVADHAYNILFTNHTSFVQLPEGSHQIDEQKFRIRTFPDFSAIVDTDTDLFDVLGHIRLVSGDNLRSTDGRTQTLEVEGTGAKDRVFLHLFMKDGETLRVYLWGPIAAAFRATWNKSGPQPNVVLITTVNPKTFGGALSVGSTSSTRLFFDTDIAETAAFLTWLGDGSPKLPVLTASSAITKLETVSIEEILQFIKNEDPKTASFYVSATIVDVLGDHGWNYISCSFCNTKLGKTGSSMYCSACDKTNNVGVLRYRLEILVSDKKGDVATFVLFDRDATSLFGRKADALLSDSASIDAPALVPPYVKRIIGRSFKFQIKITSYNFTAVRQLFTISRVMEPTTAEDLEVKTSNENVDQAHKAASPQKGTKYLETEDGSSTQQSKHDSKRIRLE